MYPVDNRVDLATLNLVLDSVSEKSVARLGLEIHDTLVGVA